MHVPSQPLMRSLLSQSLTPTGSSQSLSDFSGPGMPRIASLHLITQSTSDQPLFYFWLTLSTVDVSNPILRAGNVNAREWCNRGICLEPSRCAAQRRNGGERREAYSVPA